MLSDEQKEKIIKLRNNNKSYREIAKIMGRTKGSIYKYCKRNVLGGRRGIKSLRKREEEFKQKFEEKFSSFEYIRGYINSESKVEIKCKICGYTETRSASCTRKGHSRIKCDKCNKIRQLIEVIKDNIDRIKYQKQMDKWETYRKKVKLEIIALRRIKKNHRYYKKCTECGRMFFTKRKNTETCSDKCKKHKVNRIKEIRRREKLKENGKINYNISLERLIDRDNGICQLCGEPIDKDDYYYDEENNFITGNKYPSIDHIIPVIKGGTHTWDNVQLAHRHCNSIKSGQSAFELEGNKVKISI
jgi:5-methylcytosine-specific restriction endonuclease McrA